MDFLKQLTLAAFLVALVVIATINRTRISVLERNQLLLLDKNIAINNSLTEILDNQRKISEDIKSPARIQHP